MGFPKKWNIKECEVSDNLVKASLNSRILAVLLKNRGIDTEEKIYNFLNPLKSQLINPDIFCDIEKAAKRIFKAIENKENITIYGDFDTDGITSSALMYLTLKQLNASVDYYIPDRTTESHGLNTKALVKIISKRKTKLIITVDCGISDIEEVKFAASFKTDVIITDHHEAPAVLPSAYAVINPKASDSVRDDASMTELESLNNLAGVGVAFKLACKLLEMSGKEDTVNELLPLAALGTIADVVKLTGENRTLTEAGLELIRNGRNKGIQILLQTTGIQDIKKITSYDIAFSVVPRLNAAGRLESPYTALNLLIEDEQEHLEECAKTLNDLNNLRQQLCDETFEAAKSLYEKDRLNNKNFIMLFCEDWHIGIIGIVSSKVAETYNKPAFLMTRDTTNHSVIRCSCRSTENIDIHALLAEHKEVFEGFGGHKMAAGFSFDENKITFADLKSMLNKTFEETYSAMDLNNSEI